MLREDGKGGLTEENPVIFPSGDTIMELNSGG
jgi:hypothetical protein